MEDRDDNFDFLRLFGAILVIYGHSFPLTGMTGPGFSGDGVRARLAGKKIVHRATAALFHDKRGDDRGGWMASAAINRPAPVSMYGVMKLAREHIAWIDASVVEDAR